MKFCYHTTTLCCDFSHQNRTFKPVVYEIDFVLPVLPLLYLLYYFLYLPLVGGALFGNVGHGFQYWLHYLSLFHIILFSANGNHIVAMDYLPPFSLNMIYIFQPSLIALTFTVHFLKILIRCMLQ